MMKGRVLPVIGSQLRGLYLKAGPLFSFSLFWRNAEPEKHYVYRLLVKENDVVFDVGANVGLHSYYFSKNYKSIQVFAFEPQPDNISFIKETISRNKLKNIELVDRALGAKEGEIYFDTASNNSQGFITETETGLKVKVDTLDHFITSRNLFPKLIKVDVEGAESQVLEGFRNSIEKILPILVIELHTPENDRAVSAFFQNYDYTIFRLNGMKECEQGKPFQKIKNLNATWPDPEGIWGNIIAVPASRLHEVNDYVA